MSCAPGGRAGRSRGLGRKLGGRKPTQMASEDLGGRSGSRHDQHGSPRPAAARFDPAPSADGRCTGKSSCCSRGPSVRVAIGLMLPPTRACDASGSDAPLRACTVPCKECVAQRVRVVRIRISRIQGKAMNFALAWSRVYYGLLPTIYHLPSNGLSIAAPISDCARIAIPTGLL